MKKLLQWLFGPATDRLPPRVREAILKQQDDSERLIGWFQLIVVLLFGTLWAIAPKTASGEGALVVPAALGLYLLITLVRLLWSYRARLPAWALALSVVFDITLLMVVIWSFHLTYHQPPSFYLKAPTLLYVFIFIALRALRFEARYVLLGGVMAALGWGVLVAYVLKHDASNPMLTRNYVTYLTDNAVLLGAEFDKIISILTVTLIIAVAIGRAKTLLLRSVTEELASRELSRFFDAGVAARIKGSAQAIEAGMGELRDAAILSLDLRGFTKVAADYPPEATMALLSEYQARLVPVIQKHGGAVDKFLGDGILCSFGAVVPSKTCAADALAALQEVMEIAARWQAERAAAGQPAPRVNGALATGRVLFGAVGNADRLEYTVIGDAVNLAAKLEKQNKVVGCNALTDQASYDLALVQGFTGASAARHLPQQMVAGVPQALDLVVLS